MKDIKFAITSIYPAACEYHQKNGREAVCAKNYSSWPVSAELNHITSTTHTVWRKSAWEAREEGVNEGGKKQTSPHDSAPQP